MIDRRVELPDIDLETILRVGPIPEGFSNLAVGAHDPASLDAGMGVRGEPGPEESLHDIHHGMVNDPVGEVRKLKDQSFLRLIYREGSIC